MERIAELQAELDALKSSTNSEGNRVSELETTAAAQGTILTDLGVTVADNTAAIATNAGGITTNAGGIAANTTAISALDGRVSATESGLADLTTNVIPGMQADIDDLEAEHSVLSGTVTGVAAVVDTHTTDLSNLEGEVDQNAGDILVNTGGLAAAVAADLQRQQEIQDALTQIALNDADILVLEGDVTQAGIDIDVIETYAEPFFDLTEVDASGNIVFEGTNVHIRSGSGATDDFGALTGLGNLVVGYDEPSTTIDPTYAPSDKSGSHNIVYGEGNSYPTYGGMVGGRLNAIEGDMATILAGARNTAEGNLSGIAGGHSNEARGDFSSINAGRYGIAQGEFTSIGGGESNLAIADYTSIQGGFDNSTTSSHAVVSGGRGNSAGGLYAAVAGGQDNLTSGTDAVVSGGYDNWAAGSDSYVAGGRGNQALGISSMIAGGYDNTAGMLMTLGGQDISMLGQCGQATTSYQCPAF